MEENTNKQTNKQKQYGGDKTSSISTLKLNKLHFITYFNLKVAMYSIYFAF